MSSAAAPVHEYPKSFRSWFKSAAAARRYREVMGTLRVPMAGSYGDCRIQHAFLERLNWFDDDQADQGFIQGKWIVPHLFGPDKTMWMSWHPLEVLTVWRDARHFSGGRRILVCGMGLGVFQQLVESRYEEVWTLELNPRMGIPVHKMLGERNWRLVIGDAYRFMTLFRKGAFDAAYFDIWKDFPEETYRELHRAIRDVARLQGIGQVRCWAQELAGMRLPGMRPDRPVDEGRRPHDSDER